jgi:hypothetical protein
MRRRPEPSLPAEQPRPTPPSPIQGAAIRPPAAPRVALSQLEPQPDPLADAPPAAIAPDLASPAPTPSREAPVRSVHEGENGDAERGATAPQLRRFIKSRAYVPMHELRRRFAINGADDEVTAVDIERRRVFVGLPEREGRLLGELLRGGDIGYELSLDPITPIVVGVYPMRPVTRV